MLTAVDFSSKGTTGFASNQERSQVKRHTHFRSKVSVSFVHWWSDVGPTNCQQRKHLRAPSVAWASSLEPAQTCQPVISLQTPTGRPRMESRRVRNTFTGRSELTKGKFSPTLTETWEQSPARETGYEDLSETNCAQSPT